MEPIEIKCIQGGSGDRDIDEDDCFEVPYDVDTLPHASYFRCVKPMLTGGGVFCGGVRGEKRRNRIYVSCADWVRYPEDYVAPQEPFTSFRHEPYPVRQDWEVQVRLCHKTCRRLGGRFVQTESLACAGPRSWNAPLDTIREIHDREGWVLYRRPPPLTEPFTLWSGQARGDPAQRDAFSQRFPRCTHPDCGASYPRGLVYCFNCHRVLDGAVVHNIHSERGATQRGDNSEIAEIKRKVTLTVRRLDDPAGPLRGAKQHRRLPPSDEFATYCKDLYKRTVNTKGCKLEDGTFAFYEDPLRCFRDRCARDSRYFGQIKTAVESRFPEQLGGEVFSLEFFDHMYDVGIERRNSPLQMPMAYDAHASMLRGKTAVSSNQSHVGETVPLSQHPKYRSMRAQAFNVPAPPEKGKAKGKGKGKDKGKTQEKGKREWGMRHGDNRPYW